MDSEVYTSAKIFEEEQAAIWQRNWTCVAYSSDLQPDQIMGIDVAGRSYLVWKDRNGKLGAYQNACSHRGAQLVRPGEIVSSRTLRCPYHGWNYGASGKLLGTAMFNQQRGKQPLDRGKYGLKPVPLETWGPFVFLAERPLGPLKDHLGSLDEELSPWLRDHSWKVHRSAHYEVRSNWKNAVENFLDWSHVKYVHPTLEQTSPVSNHVVIQGTGNQIQFLTDPLAKGTGTVDADCLPPLRTLNKQQQGLAHFITLFPNLNLFIFPHHIFSLRVFPGSPTRCVERAELLFTEETEPFLSHDKVDDMMAFWDRVNREDIEICERVQRGQEQTDYGGGPFGGFESSIARFQDMYLENLVRTGCNFLKV